MTKLTIKEISRKEFLKLAKCNKGNFKKEIRQIADKSEYPPSIYGFKSPWISYNNYTYYCSWLHHDKGVCHET